MHMFGGLIIRCGLLVMILVTHGPLEGVPIFLCRTFPDEASTLLSLDKYNH
jgi:hypothetical protein